MVVALVWLVSVFRAAAQNLVDNPSFELGVTNWSVWKGGTLQLSTNEHMGSNALVITSRTASDQGAQQTLTGKLVSGASYYCAGWFQAASVTQQTVMVGMQFTDDAGVHATNIAQGTCSNGGWSFLAGCFDLQATGAVQDVRLYVSGPAANVDLMVDDVAVVPLSGMRLAARKFPNVWVGGVGGDSTLKNNPTYAEVVGTDYHICGSENALKFSSTEPQSNSYSWSAADTIVNTGIANGQQTRGHTLIWHSSVPSWVSSNTWTTSQLQTILYDHIDTVAGRYKDKLFCWDVVNEALNDSNGGLRSTIWYDQPGIGYAGQGSNYIAEVFKRAHAAAPNAKLVYNDYSNEEDNTKSDAMYAMVRGFKSNAVPIDAVGFQMHINQSGPNLASMRANFQRFNDLGVDLHITELDVRINIDTNTGLATNITDLATQADTYFNVYGTALAFPRTRVLQTWGYDDSHSWVPGFFPGSGAALPLDQKFNRKLAWWAIYNVLANQAENLPIAAMSSGDNSSIVTNTAFSAGRALLFSANATNDYIALLVNVPYAGEYTLRVGVRKTNSCGQFQLAAAPVASGGYTNLGARQDLYASTTSYADLVVATNNFAVAGDYWFRFTVAGKNSSSSGYALILDYLRLTPTGKDGNQPPSVDAIPDQAVLKNQAFGPLAFRVHDRETVESALDVSIATSNPQLFPTNNLQLTQYGPQFLLNAVPAANRYGTATFMLTVQDADGTVTQSSFNITVTNNYSEPIIEPLSDLTITQDTVAVVPFIMWDTVDNVSTLTLSVSTSNTNLVPATNLVITGTGTNRTATITPLPGRVGDTVITFVLRDPGGRACTNAFTLQVSPTPLTSFKQLNNPGFESPFNTQNSVTSSNSITGLLANGWSENSKYGSLAPTVIYSAETNDVPAGSYAQKVVLATNGSPNFQIIQSFAMTNGRMYTASVWMKSTQAMTMNLSVGKSASPYSTYFNTSATISNVWRKISVSGAAPSNVTARIVLQTSQPGTFWMDEAYITSDLINTAPVLAAISNVTLNAGQTLQFTNVATDAEVPPQTLTFQLLSGPTNAVLNAANGVFLWRVAAMQAGTTNQIAVKVMDDGSPVLSATQKFTAVVNRLGKTRLTNFVLSANRQVQLRVDGDPNLDYLIQGSVNLSNWTSLNTNLSPVLPYTWTNTNALTNQYYRVLLRP